MGMFDYVTFEMDCPNCNNPITNFQSKDGPCELKKIPVDRVDFFRGTCNVCHTCVEFTRQYAEGPLTGFEMTVKRE